MQYPMDYIRRLGSEFVTRGPARVLSAEAQVEAVARGAGQPGWPEGSARTLLNLWLTSLNPIQFRAVTDFMIDIYLFEAARPEEYLNPSYYRTRIQRVARSIPEQHHQTLIDMVRVLTPR